MASMLAATVLSVNAAEPITTSIETKDQKVSYSFGLIFGKRLIKDVPSMDLDVFVQGLSDGFNGKAPVLSEQQVTRILQNFQKQQQQEQLEKIQELAQQNKEQGNKFLAENREKEGVVTLASGLQYKVLNEGSGNRPLLKDTVIVQYTGSLLNGTIFDASEPGKPITIPVNGVISAWTEALQLMPEGAKWKLFVPSELAYGTGGNRGIGPNETLLYDIELMSIKISDEATVGDGPQATTN